MKKGFCNPLNIEYKYQCNELTYPTMDKLQFVVREAADPSLIKFKGRYYLFASMSLGFWASDDLINWEYHLLSGVPTYDYAPDVCVMGNFLYFTASKKDKICSFYRTEDPINGTFEEIEGTFEFYDPHMFLDDDGKVYFYWGCSNSTPIWGVQLDPKTMKQITTPKELISHCIAEHGFERNGENHIIEPPKSVIEMIQRQYAGTDPYVEGAWMTKHNGKYYLQYACPGTEFNVYADGVYVSDSPLGEFTYAKNNPYSYKPGGFIPGAGHGSTLQDKFGNWWHASTMRISVGHSFERRIGLFPAGFDNEGELFCNQRYADWPLFLKDGKFDPWQEPEFMLLSYGKKVSSSSYQVGYEPNKAVDENVQTWWKAETCNTGEWLLLDLEKEYLIGAIQVNFADDKPNFTTSADTEFCGDEYSKKYIENRKHYTKWKIEGSNDGKIFFDIVDKTQVNTDFSHDFIIAQNGLKARFIKCTVMGLPFNQNATISGLRVFGSANGEKPQIAKIISAKMVSNLDALIEWQGQNSMGYNVLWGYEPEKLYHSYMVFGKTSLNIAALNKGQDCFVRVDSFNESGICHGNVLKVE